MFLPLKKPVPNFSVTANKVCLSLLCWKRPEAFAQNVPRILEQDYQGEVELLFWNNCIELKPFYSMFEKVFLDSGKFSKVTFHHSDKNVFSHPRFLNATKNDCEFVVTLDEDLTPKRNYISVIVDKVKELNGVCSGLGRILKMDSSYYNCPVFNLKKRNQKQVRCVGTGIACFRKIWLCHPSVLTPPIEFQKCMDMWISYCMFLQGVKRFKIDLSSAIYTQLDKNEYNEFDKANKVILANTDFTTLPNGFSSVGDMSSSRKIQHHRKKMYRKLLELNELFVTSGL